jgi:flagellar biosynthesis/type III secretory pathway protein FliH
MTSSYKATGAASVRQTLVGEVSTAGRWSLDELTTPTPTAETKPVNPAVAKALAAEEKARWIDEGYARGLADGERKGLAAGQARVNDAVALLHQASAEMHDACSLSPAILEENIAALAVVIARQIIGREVTLDSTLVADLVRRALTEFPIEQGVRVRVNPQDLAAITITAGLTDAPPITGSREASWVADPRVSRGGCLIEGRDRIIDGRVGTALERAYLRMAQLDAS